MYVFTVFKLMIMPIMPNLKNQDPAGSTGVKEAYKCTLKFTSKSNFGKKNFTKYVDLVSSQVAEGIFSSKVCDFRVLNSWSFWELYRLVPPRALPWTYEGASVPPRPKPPAEIGFPKKYLNTSLHIFAKKPTIFFPKVQCQENNFVQIVTFAKVFLKHFTPVFHFYIPWKGRKPLVRGYGTGAREWNGLKLIWLQ